MSRIKVLILSHSSEMSGAERSMFDLFDYWVKKGLIEPHFIIRKPLKNMTQELKKRGWSYTSLYYTNWSQRNPSKKAEDIFRNAVFNTQAVFDIERYIQKIKPDIVMTNTIVSPWAAIAAYFQGIPHVWFVREYGDIDHQHIFELGREKMLQDIDVLSDIVVTNSKTLAEHISSSVAKESVVPLYTPFDLDALERKSQQKIKNPFKNDDSFKLVITGRIAPSKGQSEAAEAIGLLTSQGHNVELCVIGVPADPHDADELKHIIERYDITERVHLIGQQSNPLAILKLADVGIMASKQEAFGRVTFEYMATGRPVIGANSGATPEMIDHNKNGFLYEPGSVESLTDQLVNYLNNPKLIAIHGKAAKEKAEQLMKSCYNADELHARILAVLQSPTRRYPLNFAHRWLEYPSVAKQYIEDSKAISLKKIIYQRARHRAKWVYLSTARVVNYVKNGFKKSSELK